MKHSFDFLTGKKIKSGSPSIPNFFWPVPDRVQLRVLSRVFIIYGFAEFSNPPPHLLSGSRVKSSGESLSDHNQALCNPPFQFY